MDAIKNWDSPFVMNSLEQHPNFVTKTDSKDRTPVVFAAENGCPSNLFLFILRQSSSYVSENQSKIKELLNGQGKSELQLVFNQFISDELGDGSEATQSNDGDALPQGMTIDTGVSL